MAGSFVVLLGAALLVLRANLPRWVFGTPFNIDERWTLVTFLSYLAIGFCVLACMMALETWAGRRPTLPLWLRLAGGSLLIVAVIGATMQFLIPAISITVVGRVPRSLTGYWIMSSVLSISAWACLVLLRHAREKHDEAQRLQREQDDLERDLARAELATLEAQIEPHFLFNTLAHVKRQFRTDPPAADRMLRALTDYLERAMPALHSPGWTLGDELDLIAVYLDILSQRFGPRLRFSIETDPEDRSLSLPALTITTLVENAVRHGLAPKAEGGTLYLRTRRENARLIVEVLDDGVGLRQGSGSGLGLATVRARLKRAFGDGAALLVEPASPAGVRSLLTLAAP